MSPIINRRNLFRFSLLQFATTLLLFTSTVFGQDVTTNYVAPMMKTRDQSQRPIIVWQDSVNLTWDDFTPMEKPESDSRSNINIFRRQVPQSLKISNTTYVWSDYTVIFNPNSSFYNPETATDWELRYFNTIFDIAELAIRLTLDPPQNKTGNDFELYSRYANACLDAFEMESSFGKDTAVILAYEKEVREALENNPRTEFSTDLFQGDFRFGFSEHIDYSNSTIIGKGADIFQSFNGFSIGVEAYLNKVKIDGTLDFLWSRTLVSGLFNDTENGYEWVQGRKTTKNGVSWKIGYLLFSNDYIAVYPVAGIGFDFYNQSSKDKEINKKCDQSTITSLPCWTFGFDTDWTITRSISSQSIGSQILRLKLYGTFEKNKVIGDVWSLNVGLSYVMAVRLKNESKF